MLLCNKIVEAVCFMENVFSSKIKEMRMALNQTQSEFADFIGTTQSALSGYENGDRTPSYEILVTIAKKCSTSIDWMCGLSNKKNLNSQITTYKELFTLFIDVLDARYEDEKNTPIIDIIDTEKMSVILTLHKDHNFQTFFSKWCSVFKLHCDGTIDKDLYTMWIEKQLAEYDRPINGIPF